jgi:hypothetical protein
MLIKWEYSRNVFRPETIETVAQRSQERLRWYIANHSSQQGLGRI